MEREIVVKFSPSFPLIQFYPYNYGSIIRGHLEQEVITVAFSKDIGSAGKFSFFHDAIFASVVNTFKGVIPSVIGIPFSMIPGSHYYFHNLALNLAEKAPI